MKIYNIIKREDFPKLIKWWRSLPIGEKTRREINYNLQTQKLNQKDYEKL